MCTYLSQTTGNHLLGHWEAKEFAKFVIVPSYVLHELIPMNAYHCFCLLYAMYKLVYSTEL